MNWIRVAARAVMLTYILSNVRNKGVRLPTLDEFANLSAVQPAAALFNNLE